jgi:hypothetical protein
MSHDINLFIEQDNIIRDAWLDKPYKQVTPVYQSADGIWRMVDATHAPEAVVAEQQGYGAGGNFVRAMLAIGGICPAYNSSLLDGALAFGQEIVAGTKYYFDYVSGAFTTVSTPQTYLIGKGWEDNKGNYGIQCATFMDRDNQNLSVVSGNLIIS